MCYLPEQGKLHPKLKASCMPKTSFQGAMEVVKIIFPGTTTIVTEEEIIIPIITAHFQS